MASVRKSSKKHSSSPPCSTRTAEENPSAPIVKNTFVNDGSFLELFKKRMEAESSQKLQPKSGSTVEDREDDETKGDEGSSQEKLSEGKVPGPSISLTQQVWFSEERMLGLTVLPFLGKDQSRFYI